MRLTSNVCQRAVEISRLIAATEVFFVFFFKNLLAFSPRKASDAVRGAEDAG